jgi:uncharacterized protein
MSTDEEQPLSSNLLAPSAMVKAMRREHLFLPKDFIETTDGLLAAVVAHGTEPVLPMQSLEPVQATAPPRHPHETDECEQPRVLAYPRYHRLDDGSLQKLDTAEALAWVATRFPQYSCRSQERDVSVTAIPPSAIAVHYQPERELQASQPRYDNSSAIEPAIAARVDLTVRLTSLLGNLSQSAGITGSRLIGADRPSSDVDLVIYGRVNFHSVLQRCKEAFKKQQLNALSVEQWQQVYERRGCVMLSWAEYCLHEQRKFNKLLCEGLLLDLTCVDAPHPAASRRGRKIRQCTITARVIDDRHAYDNPAVFELDHPEIQWLIIYTATYVGQARTGETIEACGCLESLSDGRYRLVVGASREAAGEFVRSQSLRSQGHSPPRSD